MPKFPNTPDDSDTRVDSIDVLIYDYLLTSGPYNEATVQELIDRFPQHEGSIRQFLDTRDQISSVFKANIPPAEASASSTIGLEAINADGEIKIFGEFQLIRILGYGGMGVVYEAMHPRLNRRVALKLCKQIRGARNETVSRFRLEAETACRLEHPNIVQFIDCGELEGEQGTRLKQHGNMVR